MFLIRFVKVVNNIKNPYSLYIAFDYKYIVWFYKGASRLSRDRAFGATW